MNQYIQIIFYHFILSEPSLALRMNPDFFDAKSIQVCFKYAREYVIKYHQAPSASQLKELLHLDNKQDVVSDDNVICYYCISIYFALRSNIRCGQCIGILIKYLFYDFLNNLEIRVYNIWKISNKVFY